METNEDEDMEGAITVPEAEPVVPGVSIVEISESDNNDDDDDLRRLNERADKLCQGLKELNTQAQTEAEQEGEQNEEFKEIMRQYSDFIIIIRSDETGSEETIDHTDLTALLPVDDDQEQATDIADKANLNSTDAESNEEIIANETQERDPDEKVIKPEMEYSNVNVKDGLDFIETDVKKEEVDQKLTNFLEDKCGEQFTFETAKETPVDKEVSNLDGIGESKKSTINKPITDLDADTKSVEVRQNIEGSCSTKDAHEHAIEESNLNSSDSQLNIEMIANQTIQEQDPDGKISQPEMEEMECSNLNVKDGLEVIETVEKKEEENQELTDLLDQIKHFKPKRPQVPQPQFPDLQLSGETSLRQKCHGNGHFWHMPFRHQLFKEEMKNHR